LSDNKSGGEVMLPLVSVPDFVHQYARRYRDLFSPSLQDHFERYLSGLYVCDRRNAQMINDAFVVEIKDQSSLNRFLTEYEWSTEQVNERRLKLLRDDEQTRPRRSGVLPIDDTFNEKFGLFRNLRGIPQHLVVLFGNSHGSTLHPDHILYRLGIAQQDTDVTARILQQFFVAHNPKRR
jgi:hypothetical protein